ncbi:choice-of-anchor D domain-containing protein [Sandaracinobacter sp. RS1-74]|uniref:choice-of-anchor D domain-containing protein n=1 Tax=Sandaracinobacteroides sayramensis TaxID=2913411 RepID=UPI001EDB8AC3|nr:choice-of-anchor D domain-containing protein [Sandaracinobacteroides sayramensis]
MGNSHIVISTGKVYRATVIVNNGLIEASTPGGTLYTRGTISGNGTLRSGGGAKLQINDEATTGNLVNDGSLQLNTRVTVLKDYSGAQLGSGNGFNGRNGVSGSGGIFAADAQQVVSGNAVTAAFPNVSFLDFGTLRVGDSRGTNITIRNAGRETRLRGAVQNVHAPDVSVQNADFVLDPFPLGGSHVANLRFNARTAGTVSGQALTVANNFDNVANHSLIVRADVYAPAVATRTSRIVDFGVVRGGTAGFTSSTTIRNTASGALTDHLRTSVAVTPGHVNVLSVPGLLAAGQSGVLRFGLDTGTAGLVNSTATLGFTSVNPVLADLALESQTISFFGTVTDVAVAELAKAGGAGSFAGSGSLYTLDFGSIRAGSGPVATEIAVWNAIFATAFSETLGGGFVLDGGPGFAFAGDAFSDLAGGDIDLGNWLSFDSSGLRAGSYESVLTFNGFSRFSGLADQALGPITLNIRATVMSVPEPASWAMLIAGFGLVGGALRRQRMAAMA